MANKKTHHTFGERMRVYKKRFAKLSKAAKLQILAILIISLLIIIAASVALSGRGKNPTKDIINGVDSFAVGGSYDPAADKSYKKDEYAEKMKKFSDVILPVNQENDAKYFRETLFVGDSNTEGISTYGHLSLQYVCGMTGMAIEGVTSNECIWFVGYDKPVTMPTAVGMLKPRRVIVNFGTNNVGGTKTTDFIAAYKRALKAINKSYPYADIIVSAILPVAKVRSYPNMTMQDIDEFNLALAEMCQDENYKFLNTSEVFKDEKSGFMKKGLSASDGVHL
ncbi:MAG: GDSL-type esterase/lipase family protein, partial [Oscillospiraceae bacterium]